VKSVMFLYAKKEQSEKEIKKVHFYGNIKRNKILKNKLNRGRERLEHWKLQNIDETSLKRHQ
jgi:hypothetical protein